MPITWAGTPGCDNGRLGADLSERAVSLRREPRWNYWREILAGSPPEQINHGSWADSVEPIFEAGQAVLVAEDEEVDEGVQLLPAPGHTPGNVIVRLEGARRARLPDRRRDPSSHPGRAPGMVDVLLLGSAAVSPHPAEDAHDRRAAGGVAAAGALPDTHRHPHPAHRCRIPDGRPDDDHWCVHAGRGRWAWSVQQVGMTRRLRHC
jgi:hypothetical protein